MVPSPLATDGDPRVRLYFQCGPDGSVTSPQAPGRPMPGGKTKVAAALPASEFAARLAELRAKLARPALLAAVPAAPEPQPAAVQAGQLAQQTISINDVAQSPQQVEAQQTARNDLEWNARVGQQALMQSRSRQAPRPPPSASSATGAVARVREEVLRPLWQGELLLLARRIQVNGAAYVQGCWLDWPALRAELLETARDLLPDADLAPVRGADAGAGGRTLAALPLRLIARAPAAVPPAGWTPIRLALALAWVCLLLTAATVGAVLWGAVTLGERRAAFTSAVTHELRTPLTTFRVYTEMLAEGMVPDEAKRREYLQTLQGEAVRLSHLVENVLSYARLERGRHTGTRETVAVGAMLERVATRLQQRAAQAGLRLEAPGPEVETLPAVTTDPSAVEQILFNLVDNACKYAARAADARIHLEVKAAGSQVRLRVRDHGPGISAADRRHLFKPFRKSAEHAAASAPGVGLGLALSRRLARALGGDLRLAAEVRDGAAFDLLLPAA